MRLAAALAALAFAACGARSDVARVDVRPSDGGVLEPGHDATTPPRDAIVVDAPARPERTIRVTFMPAARVQLAVWIESEDGALFETIVLTEATAYRGIGNRPGALQMNSGFRWPIGRREGVLPYWAHRRVLLGGAPFRRVIHGARLEGLASRTTEDSSPESYFCLSFNRETTRRDALDAVSCASPFNGPKGRYITDADVAAGYAEPFESAPAVGSMRPLSLESLYPPRRDLTPRCAGMPGCFEHEDSERYASDALAVMPELDAITMATPPAGTTVDVDVELPAGVDSVTVHVEANTEGDYFGDFGPDRFPTPAKPDDQWDYWAREYGYPYRGQPSVVFTVPVTLGPCGAHLGETRAPIGITDVHGLDGDLRPIDGSIADDPTSAPGSGADRLRHLSDGSRVSVAMAPCR